MPLLDSILHAYLRRKDKGYLIPFLEGLTSLGRPSAVTFPLELLEQGAAILLSGLNNTMAIQSNLDWVWPLWVERQADPEGREFIPTAINLIMTNLTCRNWTSLGLPDSPREAMVDPAGMFTLHPYGWSVFPYVRMEGRNHFPPRMPARGQVAQSLSEGTLPCVITEYRAHPSLGWSSEAMAMRLKGEEVLAMTHTLVNRSASHLSLVFGLAIRPYNPLTIGHINSLRYRKRRGMFQINGEPGLLLTEAPDHVVLSDRHHGDPLLKGVLSAGRLSLKSRSGIACALAEYRVELPPGSRRAFESAGLLQREQGRPRGDRLEGISKDTVAFERRARKAELREARGEGLRLKLPDPRLQEAFEAVKNHLHVFDDGGHFSPGTFLYHTHWFRDSAFIALAFENMGFGARVRPKLLAYPSLQTGDGFFKSQRGEWDSNGQAMWTLVNHARRGGDASLLEMSFPSLIKGARWIAMMRGKTRRGPSPHFGLLPAGFSAEHFGPNDHYYWDNLWSLSGLDAALWAARKLGRAREADWLAELALEYRGDLSASMEWARSKNEGILPCSPYRAPDSAAIGNLVGISPLETLGPSGAESLRPTLDFLARDHLRDGLFFQRIVHTGLNPYLSVQMARAMLALGDTRFPGILAALMRRASPTWTWPEAMHPRMFGGCMGDGDHGWSAAEFASLIREMLVSERGGSVWLCEGAPASWFKPGLRLEVTGASTAGGTLGFAFVQQGHDATFSWRLRREGHQDPAPLILSLPRDYAAPDRPEVTYEVRGETVSLRLPGDSGSLLLHQGALSGQPIERKRYA